MISNREDNSYKSYLWGDVRSSGGGKVHRVKMMLDCGNLLPDAVAISKSFFLRSGLKLVSKNARRCTTAKTGGSIKAIGIASPICIQVPGISKTVEIQAPIILEGLTDEVNLGNKALQQWKVNMKFRPDGTYLYTQSGGESVALIANLTDDTPSQAPGESRGRGTKRVHTQKSCLEYVCPGKRQRDKEPERMPSKQDIIAGCDTVLKPNHLTFIQCEKVETKDDIIVEPHLELSTCQAVAGAYKSVDKIAYLNLSDKPIVVKKGMKIAKFRKLELM